MRSTKNFTSIKAEQMTDPDWCPSQQQWGDQLLYVNLLTEGFWEFSHDVCEHASLKIQLHLLDARHCAGVRPLPSPSLAWSLV